MFDRISSRYDLVNRVMTFGMDVGWRRRAVRELRLPGDALVADLACGTGDLCNELVASGYRTIGFDFSHGMLRNARTQAPVVEADVLRLPLADGRMDGATCGFALRNVTDLTELFAETARVLRPGGRVAFLETSEPDGAYSAPGTRCTSDGSSADRRCALGQGCLSVPTPFDGLPPRARPAPPDARRGGVRAGRADPARGRRGPDTPGDAPMLGSDREVGDVTGLAARATRLGPAFDLLAGYREGGFFLERSGLGLRRAARSTGSRPRRDPSASCAYRVRSSRRSPRSRPNPAHRRGGGGLDPVRRP